MKPKTYDNPPIGCHFDGAAGQTYNDLRVIELALRYGWECDEATEVDRYSEDDLFSRALCESEPEHESRTGRIQELVAGLVDDAEAYLNDCETRPFLSWQWHDGDFGLYPDVEGAKEDVGFVSVRSLQDARRMGIETDPEDSAYPPPDYRGEWLHVNDHGNCTLYVREDFGTTFTNRMIWSVV